MYLRRYNPLSPSSLRRTLHSYYRNPTAEKRQRIEAMLDNAISAMNSVEQAMSQSHQLVISLFREFLDDDVSAALPEDVLEDVEDILEPVDPPLIDLETGEPRFKILKRAFSKNKALIEQLEYLSRKISQRR